MKNGLDQTVRPIDKARQPSSAMGAEKHNPLAARIKSPRKKEVFLFIGARV